MKLRVLSELPDALFGCTGLVTLCLDGTFGAVPPAIGRLTKLRRLELPSRGPLAVPDELYALNLETFEGPHEIAKQLGRSRHTIATESDVLDIESYRFAFGDIAEQLARLARAPHLRELELVCQETTHVPDAIGALASLEKLRISMAKLATVSDAIGKLAKLRELRFWDSALAAIPSTIGALSALELLDVRASPLLLLPDSIGALPRLVTLLANTQLPSGLAASPALQTLYWKLEGTPTQASLAALAGVASLREIVLEQAKLVDLDEVGRAFAGHGIERLAFGRSPATGGDLSKLPRLRELCVTEAVADSLTLGDGTWTRTLERKGIARFRRRLRR